MGIFLRLLFLLAFSWVAYVLCTEAGVQAHAENPDNSKVALLFAGLLLDGAAIGLIVTLIIVPALGERIGAYFYSPGEKIEKDPHAEAIAKLAQGDPEGAISDYEAMLKKDRADTLALSEIARICCRDLGDTARAATVLEHALEEEWPHEQSSFLANRLADIYLLQEDPVRARHLLIQIAESMEGTKYAANALHRLHEVDRAIDTGHPAPAFLEESPAEPDEALPAPGDAESRGPV